MKFILKKNTIYNLVLLIICILCFLFPISKNGNANIILYEIISLVLVVGLILILLSLFGIEKNTLMLYIFLLMYLSVGTFLAIGEDTKFSIFRFFYIVIPLTLLTIVIKNNYSIICFDKILDYIFIFLLIGNIASYFNLFNINNFLVENYTQYSDIITSYHLNLRKPVLVFGVHNIASFFYMGLFLIVYFNFYIRKRKKYLVQCIIYFIYLLLLKCSTSFIYIIFSILIIIYTNRKKTKIVMILGIILILGVLFFSSSLFDIYQEMLYSNENGFISRYLNGLELYKGNLTFLAQNLTGLGFTVASQNLGVYYADSGYLVTLTTGNVLYFILFYFMFFNFINKNIKNKTIRLSIISMILIMDFGFVTFYYYRTILFIFIMVAFFRALEQIKEDGNII